MAKTLFLQKKRHFAAPLKETKTFFVKKNRGFVDSEFVKICHEQMWDEMFWNFWNGKLKEILHTFKVGAVYYSSAGLYATQKLQLMFPFTDFQTTSLSK